MAVRSFAYQLMEQYYPAVIHGHDKTLNQQCMLTQAPPTPPIITNRRKVMITNIHLESVEETQIHELYNSVPQERIRTGDWSKSV